MPNELVQSTEVLVFVAMGLELRVVERALRKPYKDVSNCFPSSVANALAGLVENCPILIIRTRDYCSFELYAATSSILFATYEVDEVLKIGMAVYKATGTTEWSHNVVMSLGDLCIMDGSHSRPVLTIVKDEYGVMKR